MPDKILNRMLEDIPDNKILEGILDKILEDLNK